LLPQIASAASDPDQFDIFPTRVLNRTVRREADYFYSRGDRRVIQKGIQVMEQFVTVPLNAGNRLRQEPPIDEQSLIYCAGGGAPVGPVLPQAE
jgi:hypothetical protein